MRDSRGRRKWEDMLDAMKKEVMPNMMVQNDRMGGENAAINPILLRGPQAPTT